MSEQTKLEDPQQINFIVKLLKNTGATMFFIVTISEETVVNVFWDRVEKFFFRLKNNQQCPILEPIRQPHWVSKDNDALIFYSVLII